MPKPIPDKDIIPHIDPVIKDYRGNVNELEQAIGVWNVGRKLGWKVMLLVHDRKTLAKYEKILGIAIRETFPEVGPSAYRMMGFRMAETVSNFWKLISGAAEEGKQMDRQERRRVEA